MEKDFTVCTDALKKGLGAMLIQDGGVIDYSSRKLKKHEDIYTTHDLDLETIMISLKLWRHYPVGRNFELKTNHESLKNIFTQRDINARQSVTHDFGRHDDVLMMVYSGSSLELSPEKTYLHLFPEITFLRTVCRLLVYLPARMHDYRRLP
jgi:hypothetical protein